MAIQYLSKDSIGSVATMNSIIAAQDSIGYSTNDFLMLSVLNLRTGNNKGASDAIQRLIDSDNTPSAALRIKSYLGYLDGKNADAIAWSDKAINAGKQEINNYLLRGILYLLSNDTDNAYKYFEAAWYIDPTNSDLNQILEHYFVEK